MVIAEAWNGRPVPLRMAGADVAVGDLSVVPLATGSTT